MTQILVTLNEGTSVQGIRRAIGMLKGVVSTSLYKDAETKRQQEHVKRSLTRAFKEMKEVSNSEKKFQTADAFLNKK